MSKGETQAGELFSVECRPSGRAAVCLLYAEAVSEAMIRQVNRWKAAGKAAGMPAPVETPGAMVEWYEKMRLAGHFQKPCPDVLRLAASKVSPAVDVAKVGVPEGAGMHHYEITAADLHPRAQLARVEEEVARLHMRYIEARGQGAVDSELDVHRKRWSEMSDLLTAQRARFERSKALLDPSEVESAFRRMVLPLPEVLLRSFPKEPPSAETWLETVRSAIRAAFARLPASYEELLA